MQKIGIPPIDMTNAKPRLLPETAEIALTEIKRTFESSLSEAFQLRRVSAPLYLPVDSGLCGRERGVRLRIATPEGEREVEVVTSLDKWCRSKLAAYDIAPRFGLFTVENALLPAAQASSLSSPHLDGWAWEMALRKSDANRDSLINTARTLYRCILQSQEMITAKFPHLHPMLPESFHIVDRRDAKSQSEIEQLVCSKGCLLVVGTDESEAPADVDQWPLTATFYGCNNLISKAVKFATIGIRVDGPSLQRQAAAAKCEELLSLPFHQEVMAGRMPMSVGGFVSRKHLAMLLLHQVELQ